MYNETWRKEFEMVFGRYWTNVAGEVYGMSNTDTPIIVSKENVMDYIQDKIDKSLDEQKREIVCLLEQHQNKCGDADTAMFITDFKEELNNL